MNRIPTSIRCVAGLVALSAGALGAGCGEDSLGYIPFEQPPPPPPPTVTESTGPCTDGSPRVAAGNCPIPVPRLGTIAGRVCDATAGSWLAGVTASVEIPGGTLSDVSDATGRYELANIPVGSYVVTLSGTGVSGTLDADVFDGLTTTIGALSCRTPAGILRGRVCDESTGLWVPAATITLDDGPATTTTSDVNGFFEFYDLPIGDYIVSIASTAVNATIPVTIVAGLTTDISPASCTVPPPPLPGGVSGRICAGNYWLAGAAVTATGPDGVDASTVTDSDGFFTLDNLAPGDYTIDVAKGSFSLSIDATVVADTTTVLAAPVCIPPTTNIAVVTGIYDQVELVLDDLGFPVRDIYDSSIPNAVNAAGNVDLIYGRPSSSYWGDWAADPASYFWATSFLTDLPWMEQYDIIFLNCGVNDWLITENNPAVTNAVANLETFVQDGGSLYVSDWASELMELAFPNSIKFIGNDAVFGNARWGIKNQTQPATVADAGLQAALTRTSVSINFNLDYWVVMATAAAQPASLNILVTGNVQYFSSGPSSPAASQSNTPLVVHFDHGAGRVLYTSGHLESQTTADLRDILNYAVFEL